MSRNLREAQLARFEGPLGINEHVVWHTVSVMLQICSKLDEYHVCGGKLRITGRKSRTSVESVQT